MRPLHDGIFAFAAMSAALFAAAAPAGATERRVLGIAAIGSNDDFLSPGILDRWRSGALQLHGVWGSGWSTTGALGFGEVLEFRFRGETITPADVDAPAPGDRPYAGPMSFGLHTHWREGALHLRTGAALVLTGPQTGISDLQKRLHEAQDLPDPSSAAEDQIGDAAYLTLSGEAAYPIAATPGMSLRPFAEARAGDETFARIGIDLLGGSLGTGGLLVREYATGQLVEAVRGDGAGFGWSAGLDVAAVAGSVYLPDDDGRPGPENMRARARVGAMWAGERWSVFAGTAYLSEEFEGQSEGQVVGSIAVAYGF